MEDLVSNTAEPRSLRRVARSWGPVVVYCAAIFAASSMPGTNDGLKTDLPIDKVLHLVVYAGLGVLLYRAFSIGPPQLRGGIAIAAAISIGLAYGISDELHQTFTPGRDADILDVVADLLGCASGACLARVFYDRTRK